MSDRIAGVLILAFSVWYGLEAQTLKLGYNIAGLTGRDWPTMLAVILGLLTLYIIIRPDPEPEWPPRKSMLNIVMVALSFIIYAYILVPTGFLIATTLETGLLSNRFGATPPRAILVGLGTSLVIYILFVYALGIPLPIGRLFGGR